MTDMIKRRSLMGVDHKRKFSQSQRRQDTTYWGCQTMDLSDNLWELL